MLGGRAEEAAIRCSRAPPVDKEANSYRELPANVCCLGVHDIICASIQT